MRYFTLLIVLAGCSQPVASPKPSPVVKASQRLTREDFDKLVIGKTTDEVLRLAGKPDDTTKHSEESESWSYKNIAIDKVTGKTGSAIVHFKSGTVDTVSY